MVRPVVCESPRDDSPRVFSPPVVAGQQLFIWIIAAVLFAVWLVQVLRGKGGFVHILILCAVAVAVVQWAAERRAARG